MSGINVTLTVAELRMACTIGCERQLEALRKSLPDRYGYEGDGWGIHIEGAAGELAVAKALLTHWQGSCGTFRQGGDVGHLQVRTRSRDDHDLIIRERDDDNALYVLVVGRSPHYRVVGYLRGRDAKQTCWLQGHGGRQPAYFVPQRELIAFRCMPTSRLPE